MQSEAGCYEEDEPLDKVARAFDDGAKGLTARPVSRTRANNGYLRSVFTTPTMTGRLGVGIWRSADITTSLAH